MTPRTLVHTALLMAAIVAVGAVVMDRASAAECELIKLPPHPHVESAIPGVLRVGNDASRASLALAVGESCVFDFPHVIKDVLVGDPVIANVVVRSSTRLISRPINSERTNIIVFDAERNQMARFDISVGRDVNATSSQSREDPRYIPTSKVNVESIGDGIILTGTVLSPADAQQAFAIATRFISTGSDFASSSTGSSGAGGSSGGSVTIVTTGP